MNIKSKLIPANMAASGLILVACSESPEDAAGDLAKQKMESQEDVLEEQADLAKSLGNEAQQEALDKRADSIGDAAGEAENAAEQRVPPVAN